MHSKHIFKSREECAEHCAEHILDRLRDTLKRHGFATIALSGGHTPKPMFAKLAAAGFDWSQVHFFWVDERCVPPESDESNFKLANQALLAPARIPATNIHRVKAELPPEEAAAGYVSDIQRFFQLGSTELPVFDVIHRGIGNDAHTASLFPGEPLIRDRTGIAAAIYVEKLKSHRVTLMPGVLLAARSTVIQAEGEDKAQPIYSVLFGPEDPMQYPCQIAARGSEKAVWFLDQAAASKLP
ncbi:MAG TPA: 6-phosphogluconolactonase [Bryobacteraceae bacterium]